MNKTTAGNLSKTTEGTLLSAICKSYCPLPGGFHGLMRLLHVFDTPRLKDLLSAYVVLNLSAPCV